MSSFGDRFKKLRVGRGLTQDQLVDDFNSKYGYSFTKATISQYENNKRTPEMSTIMKFTEYFDVSLDYLLCNDIQVIREIGDRYKVSSKSDFVDLDDIINLINTLNSNDVIKLDGIDLDNNQKRTLKNCLDVALELVKRDRKNEN